MKEPDMITCPHCGKETAAGDVCRHCGRDIRAQQGLEVQYKDFKGSEMLDIKMSSPAGQRNAQSAHEGPEAEERSPHPDKKHAAGKPLLFFGVAVLIILSAFGWYYLFKFFLKF
ncbi:MAG: hypothetical protein EPN25_09170 [Nitrospirae bacterium]|nr:MAG: hypothetical protein EPN25_09170 [Nitrospirota bacterium]